MAPLAGAVPLRDRATGTAHLRETVRAQLRESLLASGMISPEDMGLLTVVDSVDEAVATVRAAGVR